jgi:hypothetical protein
VDPILLRLHGRNRLIHKDNTWIRGAETGFAATQGVRQDGTVARIELPESWAGVAEPLRALMAEVEREARADRVTSPDLAAVSAQWARVTDAIRATVRARIADAQATQVQTQKR